MNKRAGASAFVLETPSRTTQLIRTTRKFDGTDFVTWQRTLHATASLVYYCPEICEILDGQLGSELTYQTRRGPGMPATRGVTTMASLLADVKEVEELTAGGESISAFLSNILCGNRSTDNELARMLLKLPTITDPIVCKCLVQSCLL